MNVKKNILVHGILELVPEWLKNSFPLANAKDGSRASILSLQLQAVTSGGGRAFRNKAVAQKVGIVPTNILL